MQYDKSLVAHKLLRWDKFITDYHLPEWDSIPDFGLYMDQVIVLLEQYLRHHQQLRAAEDHARAGEAEVSSGTHRLSGDDPDHEAEHQHQRRAEGHPADGQQRG